MKIKSKITSILTMSTAIVMLFNTTACKKSTLAPVVTTLRTPVPTLSGARIPTENAQEALSNDAIKCAIKWVKLMENLVKNGGAERDFSQKSYPSIVIKCLAQQKIQEALCAIYRAYELNTSIVNSKILLTLVDRLDKSRLEFLSLGVRCNNEAAHHWTYIDDIKLQDQTAWLRRAIEQEQMLKTRKEYLFEGPFSTFYSSLSLAFQLLD